MVEIDDCRRVLVVDDEVVITGLLQAVLESEGYSVLTATNTQEALQLLRVKNVGQLWIDNRMPGQTGIDFVRELRQDPDRYPFVLNMRVVLMSATMREDLMVEDKALFDAFLPKPFDIDQAVGLAEKLRTRSSNL